MNAIVSTFSWLVRLFKKPAPHISNPARVEGGKRGAETRKRRVRYSEALNEIDRYLSVKRFRVNKKATGSFSGLHHSKPYDFNYAEPWILLEAFPEHYSDERIIDLGATARDLIRPLDTRIIGAWVEDNDTDDVDAPVIKGKATLQRIRQVTRKDVRGRVQMYMPYMIEQRVAFVDPDIGRAEPLVLYWGTSDFKRWVRIGVGSDIAIASEHDVTRIKIGYGLAKTRQDQWLVGLRHDNNPALLLPTDPVGVREVFRLRDLPEGKKRRSAMLHWVEGHYRQKHDDSSAHTYVRKHLRGAVRFSWNGLYCTIKPPIRSAEFSRRPDLVAERDEAQGLPPATINTDALDYPFTHEELALREREGMEAIEAAARGERRVTPANRSGSWVSIEEKP